MGLKTESSAQVAPARLPPAFRGGDTPNDHFHLALDHPGSHSLASSQVVTGHFLVRDVPYGVVANEGGGHSACIH